MPQFTGIWVPLVTPFKNGDIDFVALKALAIHILSAGIEGLVLCGSTGEAAALSEAEQLAILDSVLSIIPATKIVMGLAGSNLNRVLAMLHEIQLRELAGLLIPPPYYIRPSQAGLIEYFSTIADAAKVPIILYNIPYRTGIRMELETINFLSAHERVVAIKDCGNDHELTMQLIIGGSIDVLAGEDSEIFSTLCLGGSGAIAASAHFCPEMFVKIFEYVRKEDLVKARQLFHQLLPMIRLLFSEPNPAPIKTMLALQGFIQDELRAPMQRTTSPTIDALSEQCKSFGFLKDF